MKFSDFARFLPFYALYYFHVQKDRMEKAYDGDPAKYGHMIDWYNKIARRSTLLMFAALVPFAALVIFFPVVPSILALLVAMMALHNYGEAAIGIMIERRLELDPPATTGPATRSQPQKP